MKGKLQTMQKGALTSMTSKILCALQFKTHQHFQTNWQNFISLLSRTQEGSIILTPEVALTYFCYQRLEEASLFAKEVTESLLRLSQARTIGITMIEKHKDGFYNNLKIFHQGEMIHKQAKTKLFPLGGEHLYFKSGAESEIGFFYIDGIKCAALNCFELRFPHLWASVRGAELIFVPAQWGIKRKNHFETLCQALAIANQCFVLAANGANAQMACSSAIISPSGVAIRNDSADIITHEADWEEVVSMRKYIDVGLLSE